MQPPTYPPLPSHIPLVHPVLAAECTSLESRLSGISVELVRHYLQPYCGFYKGSAVLPQDADRQSFVIPQPTDLPFSPTIFYGGFYQTACGTIVTCGTFITNQASRSIARICVRAAVPEPGAEFTHTIQLHGVTAPEYLSDAPYTRYQRMDQSPDGLIVLICQNFENAGYQNGDFTADIEDCPQIWTFNAEYQFIKAHTPKLEHTHIRRWRDTPMHPRYRVAKMHALTEGRVVLTIGVPVSSSDEMNIGCVILDSQAPGPQIWFADNDRHHRQLVTTAVNQARTYVYVLLNSTCGKGSSSKTRLLQVYRVDGTLDRSYNVHHAKRPYTVAGIAVDCDENLLVVDSTNEVVLYDPVGNMLRVGSLDPPVNGHTCQIELDAHGSVWSMHKADGSVTMHKLTWFVDTTTCTVLGDWAEKKAKNNYT